MRGSDSLIHQGGNRPREAEGFESIVHPSAPWQNGEVDRGIFCSLSLPHSMLLVLLFWSQGLAGSAPILCVAHPGLPIPGVRGCTFCLSKSALL